jgi:hypothetical protein
VLNHARGGDAKVLLRADRERERQSMWLRCGRPVWPCDKLELSML